MKGAKPMKEEQVNPQKSKSKKKISSSDLLFYILISVTFIGTVVSIYTSKTYVESLRQKYPDYFYPTMSYITIWTIILTIALLIPKVLVENLIFKFDDCVVDKKYFTPEFSSQRKKVKRKIAIYSIKFLHYLLLTIYSYKMLDKMEWFPKELFGHGDLSKLYYKGLMSFSFFNRPEGFDLHYLINLAYTYADLICVLFIYDGQTDFLTMIFHHFCTISLILFSYYNHYSAVGSITLFLHNATDIIVYFSRSLLYVNIEGPKFKKCLSGVILGSLMGSFIYARLYVFAKVVYGLAVNPTWETYGVNESFVTLLVALYILHWFWTYKLFVIAYNSLFKSKYNDSRDFNKEENENKNKIDGKNKKSS